MSRLALPASTSSSFVGFVRSNPSLVVSLVMAALVLGAVARMALKGGSSAEYIPYNTAYNAWLSAYTTGEVSRASVLRVRFQPGVLQGAKAGATLPENPFDFSPGIEGRAYFEDENTVAFQPAAWLESNTAYTGRLDLRNLVSGIPDSLRRFPFQFRTVPQNLRVELAGLSTIDLKTLRWQRLEGDLHLADVAQLKHVHASLSARHASAGRLRIKWFGTPGSTQHHFVIDSIPRGKTTSQVFLDIDGDALGIPSPKSPRVVIPALGDFVLNEVYTYNSPEQYVVVEFSDPLLPGQNLNGLIDLGGYATRMSIDGQKVLVYPQDRIVGDVELTLAPGIRNILGYQTKTPIVRSLRFKPVKPAVELVGNGVIVPQGQTLPFVFEAVSLNAVDIRVVRIYESNVPQFLQVNPLTGHDELRRVGREIHRSTLRLDGDKSLNLRSWNRHVVDLAPLIHPEPGAIYEVSLGFRKKYALFNCEGIDPGADADAIERLDMLGYEDWDNPGYWWDYDSYYYSDWEDRDDPCKLAYYSADKVVRRNVLASSLGLLAKQGEDGSLLVATTNLKTADPLSGVSLEVLDLQQQVLARGTSGPDGLVRLKPGRKPFLLVAKLGRERGYLRLDDGSSLSMSKFDVDGQRNPKGINGFIYTERGVWRPGDPIYCGFMLQDKLGVLPQQQPISVEFFDPMGKRLSRTTHTKATHRLYTFTLNTAPTDPTGTYRVQVQVGGSSFAKNLPIETILPNRLKADLDFDAPRLKAKQAHTARLSSAWLHGAPASNLNAEVEVQYRASTTTFKLYPNYLFAEPGRTYSSEEQVVFRGRLDAEGRANLPLKLNAENAPGRLQATFRYRVFEPGGQFSRFTTQIDLDPFSTYVGVKLPAPEKGRPSLVTEKSIAARFVALSPDGLAQPRRKLTVVIQKLNWRWWWDHGSLETSYHSEEYGEVFRREELVTDGSGLAVLNFRMNRDQWGRYLLRVTDEGGHTSGQVFYVDWPDWEGRSRNQGSEAATMLSLSANRSDFKVGEEVSLTAPAPNGSRALVCLENGTGILKTEWVTVGTEGLRYRFMATTDMSPTLYASITLLHPHISTKTGQPLRLYGTVPVRVVDPATVLKPRISQPAELRPNQDVRLTVSEENGKPMTYTIAVVDEGLLDITRFKTPDPWEHFHQRQALSVRTWDVFDLVVGALDQGVRSRLAIGGGGDFIPGQEDGPSANRFRPVVKFLGPFQLQAGGSNSHTYRMPNYVGRVRTMVVAGQGPAYGSAELSTPVRSPLMVLPTLPRLLAPGESFELPVTVFLQGNLRQAQVSLKGDALLQVLDGPQNLSLNKAGERVLRFRVKVANRVGTARLQVLANGGGESAGYETTVEVRNPNPYLSDVQSAELKPGESWNPAARLLGLPGTNRLSLEVSTVPPMDLDRRLEELIHYPYGCVEQTVSSVFPQLYLSRLMDLPEKQARETERNIAAGLARLNSFQTSEGGFAYWPGGGEPDPWASSYAGHFLVEAQSLGFDVPPGLMQRWKNWQQTQARNFTGNSDYDLKAQAYRLYVLALANAPVLSSMNRLLNASNLPQLAKWHLAGAYALVGQPEVAQRLTRSLPIVLEPYRELGYTYGSTDRDQAVMLDVLTQMKSPTRAREAMLKVSASLSNPGWMSTQTAAYSLMAMAHYVGSSSPGKASYSFRFGDVAQTVALHKVLGQHRLSPSAGTLNLKNTSQQVLYVRLVARGQPLQPATTAQSSGLALRVQYTDREGNPLNVSQLAQGTDVRATATIENLTDRSLTNLAFTLVFPGGWELRNERLEGGDAAGDFDYLDVRDDRFNVFFGLEPRQKRVFRLSGTAAYVGEYLLPAATAEAMYDASLHAHTPGQRVKVLPLPDAQ